MKLGNRKNSDTDHRDLKRVVGLGVVFTLLTGCVVTRLFYIQVLKPEPWRNIAPKQYEKRERLAANRGVIYDRNLNILAMDLPTISLAADPTVIPDIEKTASALQRVLGKETAFAELLQSKPGARYVKVKSDLTVYQQQNLIEETPQGLIFETERKRVQPFETTGLQIVGVTDARHTGISGIELAFNDILTGQDGWTIRQKDGMNRHFPTVDYPLEAPIHGKHAVLTIDHAYQTVLEEELQKGLEKYQAKWGAAVLMDPHSGEILGMASLIGNRYSDHCP